LNINCRGGCRKTGTAGKYLSPHKGRVKIFYFERSFPEMKKNKMMRIASVLLVAVLLSTCTISGTFAKYASTASQTATASVATWDIDFDGDNDESKDFAFDLFATIVDTVDGNTDSEVATGKIAPGTKGSFDIVLKNSSEVDAKFKVAFTNNLDGVPLTFTYKIDTETYTTDTFVNIDMNATKTVTVSWEWAFGEKVDDNAHSGKSPSVTATVTVEQVD
jgi:hypothetical protein